MIKSQIRATIVKNKLSGGQISTQNLILIILRIYFGPLNLLMIPLLFLLKANLIMLDLTLDYLMEATQICRVKMKVCKQLNLTRKLLRKQFCGGLKIKTGCKP